ncbi:MAG: OsmC family protein [Anaerolineae bacterium]|nr:OsmC family protein [Anaerolineae bacterium]
MNQVTTVEWRERMTFDATTNSGHALALDAPPPTGDDRGARPMELLLTALAGCAAMDVLTILQKKREPVQGLRVSIQAARATEHPRVYTEIAMTYHVRGEVNPHSIKKAIELAESTYCGVGAMLRKSAAITSRFEIEPPPVS